LASNIQIPLIKSHLKNLQKRQVKTCFEQERGPCTCVQHAHDVIEIIYDISSSNTSTRKCKKSLTLFNITRVALHIKHAVPFNIIPTPEPYLIGNTSSLQNSVLKLI
jgi:hypothetical protein